MSADARTTVRPLGYMAKRVATRPAWLKAERVSDLYSVSGCISENFADYVRFWKHNGYWLFDSPQAILEVARQHAIDLTGTRLFFYEAHEREFDATAAERWTTFAPEPSLQTDVVAPRGTALEGYDVVTFSARTGAECSPLSCNGLASEVETNAHCLLESLDRARELLERGRFDDGEPGPHRILVVHSVGWP